MLRKYYLAPDGELIGEPDEDHTDIARRVLPLHGKEAQDMGERYTMMFALGYARVAVSGSEYHVEHKQPLTVAQRAAVEAVLGGGKALVFNNRRFTETKGVRGTLASQLPDEAA